MSEKIVSGDSVRFTCPPDKGSEVARKKSLRYLEQGKTYPVQRAVPAPEPIQKTTLYLQELPGIAFDADLFEKVKPRGT